MKSLTLRGTASSILFVFAASGIFAANQPARAKSGMVISQSDIASRVGVEVMKAGGNAVDAAVATAFALAVTHPTAGNIGGGGFLLFRPRAGDPEAYDFREMAPAKADAKMWLDEKGEYSYEKHHESHLSVGVPGTVAGLHLAWTEHGSLPWERLLEPAIRLAREGFPMTDGLAVSLAGEKERLSKYPATAAQFWKNGAPYEIGELLKQPDLAETLVRISEAGPAGFYEGETAELVEKEMAKNGGMITRADMKAYRAKKRTPIRGTYRGYEILSMPPPSSGGIVLVEMLNILEGFDLTADGFGSARNLHRMAEAMRRAYSDRAQYLGDPDFNPEIPIERLTSKEYASTLRKSIRLDAASKSSPESFTWPTESPETTHFSVVDSNRNAVSVTYTLEYGYGSGIVVQGAGFLLNNEMGDFNAGPGLTDARGLIGTAPNLAQPGKRMLSSMTPTILAKDSELFMVTGSPGGRTIINTVLQTILNVVDHGMNAQAAVDAGRIHHQWLPDRINYERQGFSPDTLNILRWLGHDLREIDGQGVAQVIVVNRQEGMLEGGLDLRAPDGGAAFY
ncbi:MAG TPA: gamma-glutamyltransferase [Vicinamibacteria bacterium]|nr:gamma-glutamyltransferase [Vicinamibacteria bacterium]